MIIETRSRKLNNDNQRLDLVLECETQSERAMFDELTGNPSVNDWESEEGLVITGVVEFRVSDGYATPYIYIVGKVRLA